MSLGFMFNLISSINSIVHIQPTFSVQKIKHSKRRDNVESLMDNKRQIVILDEKRTKKEIELNAEELFKK
jgi:hypothetical protein